MQYKMGMNTIFSLIIINFFFFIIRKSVYNKIQQVNEKKNDVHTLDWTT